MAMTAGTADVQSGTTTMTMMVTTLCQALGLADWTPGGWTVGATACGSSEGPTLAGASADAGARPSEGPTLAGTAAKATLGDATAAQTTPSPTIPPTNTLEAITEKLEKMENDLAKTDITDDEDDINHIEQRVTNLQKEIDKRR